MLLKDVIKDLKCEIKGNLNIDITGIQNNSSKVEKGNLFVCIRGYKVDGHKFINDAISKGAVAIMIDSSFNISNIPNEVTIVLMEDTRLGLAICSCNFYDNPSRKFKLIGITGTKGKTTTTYIVKSILEASGKKVGLIGTIENNIAGRKIENAHRTTPESIELQALFAMMVEQQVEYVVMEVSSQALKLNRVAGCDFDIGAFTNFSEDHIGANEHESMEDYFNSKLKLFDMCKLGFINLDTPEMVSCENKLKCLTKTYAIDNSKANLVAKNINISNTKTTFELNIDNSIHQFEINIPGRFSVYNSLAAISITNELGIEIECIKEGLKKVKVPGRSELVPNKLGLTVLIDYAHSPDSLRNILTAVKAYTKGRLISVFGCGGDRDNAKRPIMGEISGKIADFTIITSDNPRTEDPDKIVHQIEEGIKKTDAKYKVIVDRRQAIEYSLRIANKDDIIVLAGKGHETYQELNGKTIDFDERVVLKEIIEKIVK